MFNATELTRFEPRAFMRRAFRDFERFFDVADWPGRLGKPFGDVAWVPPVEVFERDRRMIVRAELPGIKKEEVAVTFVDGALTIEGERKLENEEKKNEWYRTERMYGTFARTIPLPEGVTGNEITATFEGGVLEVTVPLPEQTAAAAPKKIEIGGAEPHAPGKAA